MGPKLADKIGKEWDVAFLDYKGASEWRVFFLESSEAEGGGGVVLNVGPS